MKILVVDDDEVFRALVKEVLAQENYEVITANNGFSAWKILQKEKADIAILDVNMPQMSGFELLAKIREDKTFSKMPVIMLTIRAFTEDQIAGYEYGADDYLAKPFDNQILLARIKVLERRILGKK